MKLIELKTLKNTGLLMILGEYFLKSVYYPPKFPLIIHVNKRTSIFTEDGGTRKASLSSSYMPDTMSLSLSSERRLSSIISAMHPLHALPSNAFTTAGKYNCKY